MTAKRDMSSWTTCNEIDCTSSTRIDCLESQTFHAISTVGLPRPPRRLRTFQDARTCQDSPIATPCRPIGRSGYGRRGRDHRAVKRRKQESGCIWRLAQILARIELARGLPGPRLTAELELCRQELTVHSRGVSAQHQTFVDRVQDHFLDVAGSHTKKEPVRKNG